MAFQLSDISTPKKVSSVNKDRISILQREITFGSKKITNKVKEDFYTELSVLLNAGINLRDAIELLKNAQKQKGVKSIFEEIINDIVSGRSTSEAIRKKKDFSDYEYYSLKIGEESGTLSKVAEQLGHYYNRKNTQRRELISALTYPAIILTTAVLVVVFMLQFVVPMFQDIFSQQNIELPAITKFIIAASGFMKAYSLIIFGTVVALIFLRSVLQKKEWYRQGQDNFLLRLPFIGKFINTIYLAQFTQAISLLTASKIPVVSSIKLVKKMIAFHPLQKALDSVEQSVLQGKSLSQSLNNHAIFDDKMIAMVKVAEETNQNEFIFDRLNTQYNNRVQQLSKMLSTLMEPLIILFVATMVGVILIAMYLPMFKLSSVLG